MDPAIFDALVSNRGYEKRLALEYLVNRPPDGFTLLRHKHGPCPLAIIFDVSIQKNSAPEWAEEYSSLFGFSYIQ